MVDIKKVEKYIETKNGNFIKAEEVFAMFQIPKYDFKTRWQVLQIIIKRHNILLMRKSNDVYQMEQAQAIIDSKIKRSAKEEPSGESKPPVISKPINKPLVIDDSAQMYVDLISEGIEIPAIIEDISTRANAQERIAGILLVYCKELKDYSELLKSAEEGFNVDILKEMKKITKWINEIKNCASAKEIDVDVNADADETITKANYKIAFYLSLFKTNAFYSDLQGLDESSYDSFQTLLEALITGKMISFKSFHNQGNLRGLKEVRLDNCRIAFLIENGCLILLSAFVKKADVDDVVYNNIALRMALYNRTKSEMLSDYDEAKTQEELAKIVNYLKENKRVWGK